MFPLVYRPTAGILIAIVVVLAWLASRSVAWPVGLAGAVAVLTALVGHNPLPAKGATVGFAAWTLLAVGLVVVRGGALSTRVLLAGAPICSLALAGLMIARESSSQVPAYASIKVQLFVALNLIALLAGIFAGRDRRAFSIVAVLWIVLAAITALALARGLASGQANAEVGGRISLDAQNGPISLGRDAARGILVAIAFLLTSRSGGRQLFAFATLPVIAIAFIASGSRGPVIGLVVGLAFLLALTLRERRARTRIVFVVIGAVLGAVLVTQLVPGQDVHRALSVLTGNASGISTNGRTDVWAAAWAAFRAHPLLGVGTGSFAAFRPPELYPHNIFLEVGSELGVIGLLLLAVVLVSGGRAAWRAYKSAPAEDRPQAALVVALFVTALVNAQFSGDITTNSDVWLLIGLALGLQDRVLAPASATELVHRMRSWRREGATRARRRPAETGARRSPWMQAPTPRRERTRGEIVVPAEGALVGGIVDVGGRPAETGWGVASVHLEMSADGGGTWSQIPHAAGEAFDVFRIVAGFREHVAIARTHRVAELLAAELERLDDVADRYLTETSPRRPWQLGAGWSMEWDASPLPAGAYQLRAVTLDVAGSRVATEARTVQVDNAAAEASRAAAPVPGAVELEERRTRAEELAAVLSARESSIAGREGAVERLERELAARAAAVAEQERRLAGLEQLRAELVAERAALDELNATVAAEAAAAKQALAAAQARAADLAERLREVERREALVAGVDERLADVERREAAAESREARLVDVEAERAALAERLAAAARESEAAQQALAAAQARGAELAQRLEEVERREAAVAHADDQLAALEQRENAVVERERKVERLEALQAEVVEQQAAAAREAEAAHRALEAAQARSVELSRRLGEVERREAAVADADERLAALDERERAAARLEALHADAESRARAVAERETELEQRVGEITAREVTAARLAGELARRERSVEEREQLAAAAEERARALDAQAEDLAAREAAWERRRSEVEAAAATAAEDRAAAERARTEALEAATRAEELHVDEVRVRELGASAERTAAEAAAQLAQIEQRTRELEERVDAVTRREQALVRRAAELGARERDVTEAQRRAEADRAQLDAELASMQATAESLAARAYALDVGTAELTGTPLPEPPPATPVVAEPEPEPLQQPEPEPVTLAPIAPIAPTLPPAPAGFRLTALERAVAASPAADELLQAERVATLVVLRTYVGVDDVIPAEFHGMVLDVFAELV